MITAGGSGSEPTWRARSMPCLSSSSLARGGGAGSCTTMRFGSRPRSSQPASMASPMLPAPASSSVPSILRVMALLPRVQPRWRAPQQGSRSERHSRESTIRRVSGERWDPPVATPGISNKRDDPGWQQASGAWPSVSNMVEASASRLSLPAQTTNLEGLIVALAGLQRRLEQGLALDRWWRGHRSASGPGGT